MSEGYLFSVVVIFLSIVARLLRVLLGPTRVDRMLATQLCSSPLAAILLLLAYAFNQFFLCDVALVFVMLATVETVAFVRLIWEPSVSNEEDVLGK